MRHRAAGDGEPCLVAVCVATFRRPVWLRRTLLSIHHLEMDGVEAEVVVVVVDNDADGSSEKVVREVEARIKWPIRYVVEPHPGISFARNAALRAADTTDLVAFLDDEEEEEEATPGWLRELIVFHHSTGAPVVTGPEVPLFEADPPSRVTRGRFFERPRGAKWHPCGARGHGQLLLRQTLLSELGEQPFDEAMALSGGEDTPHEATPGGSRHPVARRGCGSGMDPVLARDRFMADPASLPGGTVYALSESIVHGSGKASCVASGQWSGPMYPAGRVILGTLTLRLNPIVAGAQTTALGAGMGVAGLRYEEFKRTAD